MQSRRDFAASGFQPLVEERDKAQKALADYQTIRRVIMVAQLNPFGSTLGQATKAYTGLRMPYLSHILIANDRESAEWEMAVAQWVECAKFAALRTEDLNLPSNAQQAAAAMTASMHDAFSEAPGPAPSGQEVMTMETAKIGELSAAAARAARGDRGPQEPGPAAAPARKYMEVPRMRDYLR